jgi:hypothetical protein
MDAKHAKFIVVLLAAAVLQACSQNKGPVKVQHEVTKVQAEDEKAVMDAQAYLDLVNAQYSSDVVNARVLARAHDPRNASTAATNNADARRLRIEAQQKVADALYGVEKAKARASYNIAKAQCDAHTGAASNSCRDEATANYDAEMAAAKSHKNTVRLAGTNNG